MYELFEPLEDEFHYVEEKFQFPLWKLIKKRAEEKDISYAKAADMVLPEYAKTIRYRDEKFENEVVSARRKEVLEMSKRLVDESRE